MRNLICSLAIVTVAPLFAQYELDTSRCAVTDIFSLGGGQVEGGSWISLAEMRAAAPGSELLARDLSGYKMERRFPGGQGAEIFNIDVCFNLKHVPARGTSMKLRTGIAFAQFVSADFDLTHTDRFATDTLISSGTGAAIYVDSVITSRYAVSHEHQRIGANAALLFVKDFPGHWSLYAGGELGVGATFNGITRVRHTVERYTETSDDMRDRTRDREEEEEAMRTSGGLYGNAALPFGVGYRLSKRHPFWSTLLFTMELRPGLTFGGEPNTLQDVRANFGFLYGLRVDLAR